PAGTQRPARYTTAEETRMAKKKALPKTRKAKPEPKRRQPKVAAKKPKPAGQPAIPAKSALVATIKAASQLQFTSNSQALLIARDKKKTLTLFDLESQTETPPLPALSTFTAVALS